MPMYTTCVQLFCRSKTLRLLHRLVCSLTLETWTWTGKSTTRDFFGEHMAAANSMAAALGLLEAEVAAGWAPPPAVVLLYAQVTLSGPERTWDESLHGAAIYKSCSMWHWHWQCCPI